MVYREDANTTLTPVYLFIYYYLLIICIPRVFELVPLLGHAQAQISTRCPVVPSLRPDRRFGRVNLPQICHYCTVDDKGTNYPADRMVHPSVYDTKDFHDSLMAEERKASRPDDKKVWSSSAIWSAVLALPR